MRAVRKIILPLALVAVCTPAIAQDRDRDDQRDAAADYANREGCVLPQAIAPSFNNNAAAMEQMRIAAVTVRRTAKRQGLSSDRICGSEHDPRALDGEMTMGAPQDVPQDDEPGMAGDRAPADYRDNDRDYRN
ncbi:MAG TPA: hypothetical protein VHN58_05880 [Croceicoccus sp.]|nr:hypothetical protein [Croceicoccus sp.]